jgi:hypothetical protein
MASQTDHNIHDAAIRRAILIARVRGVDIVELEDLPMADDERAACARSTAANVAAMIAEMRRQSAA